MDIKVVELRNNERSTLLDAIEHLEAVAFVPVKQRYTDAGQLAKTIASDAYENGIPQDALGRLLKILTTKTNLDQGTTTTLINNLYSAERVISKHVTQVVCCLGPSKSKPTPATQSLLVRWLILTYEHFEDKSHLGKLYAVLFNHLDMISLRRPLCHLLSLITRRKHVKPFRIQALMELIQNAGGEEKELVILLKIFKNYYPEIIIGDVGGSRRAALFFKHPDSEWVAHTKALQTANLARAEALKSSNFQVVHRGAVKRSRIEVVIPVMQTSRVSNKHTSLEELRDLDHFVNKVDVIELPNQIISTLGDSMGQKYLHLAQSEVANNRLDEWLRNFLDDKMEQIQEEDSDDSDMLSYVLDFVEGYAAYTKQLLPSVRSFLELYLKTWNGQDNQEQVLRLLRFISIEPFNSLNTKILSPLESTMLDGSLVSRTELLDFYSSLIVEWGIKLRTQPSVSEESIPFTELIKHAELLAFSIQEFISTSNDDPLQSKPGISPVLRFYQCVTDVFSYASENAHIRIMVPPAVSIYEIAFSTSVSTISILSSIMAGYKSAFEASLASKIVKAPSPPEPLYDPELVGQFNGYVMDICNLIWRNRALNREDPNAQAFFIPLTSVSAFTNYVRDINEAARHYDRESAFHCTLSSLFSLSHHTAFCNLSAACFAELEEEQEIAEHQPRLRKPVTPKSLQALEKNGGAKMTWQEYRIVFLEWLDAIGSRGTSDLMRSTMKALRG
ncbi:Centromere protein Cenp-I [Penicillium angulare]|uniref:Centromere protein Cenp-I n=1 Tax=Penicillium angulare TaxID=116970 RepID=UPI002541638F|nr:Centromere protein Cenp-I [Penicillium angulare]KAJ5280095.1 Centromere protein Cenp-I [Penicillium angulare]